MSSMPALPDVAYRSPPIDAKIEESNRSYPMVK